MPPPDPFATWLAERLGAELVARAPVGGGCIHSAWRLELADGSLLFAKTNAASALPLLEAEAEGLQSLSLAAEEHGLLVPVPLACGLSGPVAILVLSWLNLEGGRFAAPALHWRRLGAALAGLHRHSLTLPCAAGDRGGASFGWPRDNVIGSFPQRNGWDDDWGRFFVERRLAPSWSTWPAAAHPCGRPSRSWSAPVSGWRTTGPMPAWCTATSGAATPPSPPAARG